MAGVMSSEEMFSYGGSENACCKEISGFGGDLAMYTLVEGRKFVVRKG